METITIETEFIKLDALLKFAALTGTGGVTFAGHTLKVQSAQ